MADSQDKDSSIRIKAGKAEAVQSRKQEQEAEDIQKRMQEASLKAQDARKNAQKKESRAEPKSDSSDAAGILAAGAALAGAAVQAAGSGSRRKRKSSGGFLKGLLAGIFIGALAMSFVTDSTHFTLFGKVDASKDTSDDILGTGLFGYTAADFSDAILGEASEQQELVVMEQQLKVPATITDAGLFDLSIFSKVKTVTYAGTGVYTVDLKGLDEDSIAVDNEARTVTITIPHPTLAYIQPDLEKTEFQDTERGLLTFGDLKLTTEQQNELSIQVESAMRERLNEEDMLELADKYAKLKTWDTFQPLVTSVSDQYTVLMKFDDEE